MIENYLVILEDSLKQKKTILEEIAGYNVMQEVLLKQENMSLEKFDEYVDKKDTLIQKIVSLDEGFDSLYEKVREQLISNKDSYKEQIARIQQLITEVTEKGVKIQTQEARNRDLLTAYFSKERFPKAREKIFQGGSRLLPEPQQGGKRRCQYHGYEKVKKCGVCFLKQTPCVLYAGTYMEVMKG